MQLLIANKCQPLINPNAKYVMMDILKYLMINNVLFLIAKTWKFLEILPTAKLVKLVMY